MAALEALQQDAMTAFKALGVVDDDGDHQSKTTITVKSLPPQTKKAVLSSGLKSGLVLKRDEGSVWKPRLAVVRPHTFIYYFADDDDESSRPRGIIDLEYYTEVTVVSMRASADGAPDGRALRLHAPSMPMRDFFFKFASESAMHDWADALSRLRRARARARALSLSRRRRVSRGRS